MKALTPLILALFGLAAGLGAGIALKPAPEPEPAAVACAAPEADAHGAPAADGHGAPAPAAEHAGGEAAASCPPDAADPFAPVAKAEPHKNAEELAYITMDKPFVVPVFEGEKVVAMVVLSVSVETDTHSAPVVEGVKPRLRDSFLAAMFRHANSGGFNGSFTTGQKMEDLKAALLGAAHEVLVETPVGEVLITEIARQET
jgi:hypothetical protein